MDEQLTLRLKEAARAAGADLVGVADVGRFDEVPLERHPKAIFPETKSVVALAKRVTRGCLRGVEEGSQFAIYKQYANNWVPHRFLAMATVAAASFLEDSRFEAVPLPDLPPETPPMGVHVAPGRPAPNVMMDAADAAVRAGLGIIGYTGELMTPRFGHRQRVQLILTDAELAPDPLCEIDVCDRCGKCAAACPLEAFAGESERSILGRSFRVAEIDARLCARCENGASPNPYHSAGRPERGAALCMRECVAHLEAEGLLEDAFREPFRKRPAWRVDRTGRATLAGEAGR